MTDTPREAKMKRITKNRGRGPLDIERTPKKPPKMRSRSTFPQGRKIPSRPFQSKRQQ